MSKLVYLDSNALIEAIEGRSMAGLTFLRSAHARGTRFLTSELTFAEVSVKPIRDRDDLLAGLYEELIFGDELIASRPVSREVLRKSAEARAWLGGKLPDAVHVATAILYESAILVSSDQRMRMPDGLQRMAFRDFIRTDIET